MPSTLRLLPVAGLMVATLALVGCTASNDDADASTVADACTTSSGTASDSIEVTGEFAVAPEVSIPASTTADDTERTIVTQGDGAEVAAGDSVSVQYSAYNATSGEQIEATSYVVGEEQQFTMGENLLPGLVSALDCVAVGSRVAAVIPPVDAFGDAGQSDIGVAAEDSMVWVVDIIATTTPEPALARADGVDQEPTAGFPTVTLDDDGAPTIAVPDAPAPTETQVAVLKKGDGAVVADGANVTVHYTGVKWDTGEVFDSSWEGGAPIDFTTDGVIVGFSKALVGQTVGSQVIAVVPPTDGYGEAGQGDITGTDTLVFVLDILATS